MESGNFVPEMCTIHISEARDNNALEPTMHHDLEAEFLGDDGKRFYKFDKENVKGRKTCSVRVVLGRPPSWIPDQFDTLRNTRNVLENVGVCFHRPARPRSEHSHPPVSAAKPACNLVYPLVVSEGHAAPASEAPCGLFSRSRGEVSD